VNSSVFFFWNNVNSLRFGTLKQDYFWASLRLGRFRPNELERSAFSRLFSPNLNPSSLLGRRRWSENGPSCFLRLSCMFPYLWVLLQICNAMGVTKSLDSTS
jgi:hypothetical protein